MRLRMGALRILAGVAVLAALANGTRGQAPASKPVAVVDGEVITQADLDALLKGRGPTPVALPENTRRQMQMEALAMIIDDILLQKFLKQKGPRIDPAEVDKRLAELAEALKRQGKTLQDFYRESGQTEAEVRNAQTLMLQWAAYVRARITDADLKRYYDENRDFFDQVKVRASHIVFRLPPGTLEEERKAARDKLLALRQEIVSGKLDFAAAAAKYSQCPSAQNGGDIGTFPRKFVVDEAIAKAAFALAVGQVSDVVETEFGLHLIKVTERHPGQPSDFQKVKEDVRAMCAEELRQSLLTELRKTTKVEINLP
ncbi:MAG TPA: peptidylprolyl isomerase [Gemmataceae bacterium]|nr:peptidylprolyl isomerase [Gemmataceae bacterium]